MAKLKYRNDIAPQIIEEARNRIYEDDRVFYEDKTR